MKLVTRTIAAIVAAILVVLALPFFALNPDAAAASNGGVCTVEDGAIEAAGSVAGYKGEQLENAVAIMNAATTLGLGVRGQQIGVMTAMEESTLRNLSYGDNAVNPDGSIADSIGLFQQQGSWGTVAERMEPSTAARLFYERMVAVEGWESMEPQDVAHTVQVNDHAWRYGEHWDDAVEVVSALTGIGKCNTMPVGEGGWTLPSTANVTSQYGWRVDPINGQSKLHAGTDFSGGCGTPIFAAAAGEVTRVFTDIYGGWIIEIDHGGGIITWSVHSYANGIAVKSGDQVAAGQQIAVEGSSGHSTGCHLHFELHVDGDPVDALQFLQSQGVATP